MLLNFDLEQNMAVNMKDVRDRFLQIETLACFC